MRRATTLTADTARPPRVTPTRTTVRLARTRVPTSFTLQRRRDVPLPGAGAGAAVPAIVLPGAAAGSGPDPARAPTEVVAAASISDAVRAPAQSRTRSMLPRKLSAQLPAYCPSEAWADVLP